MAYGCAGSSPAFRTKSQSPRIGGFLCPTGPSIRHSAALRNSDVGPELLRACRWSRLNLKMTASCKYLVMVAIIASLASCATTTVVVSSNPEGAALTSLDTAVDLGRAPVQLVFDSHDLDEARSANGCFQVRGIEAVWESGASITSEAVAICDTGQRKYEMVLLRPADYPDIQRDLDFARNLRAADLEEHRRDLQSRTQYFPLQTPTKPNGPAQPPSSNSP